MILGRDNSSMAVVMHLLISSCIKSDVVIDFFIIVRIMLSENGYIRLWRRRIISFRHIKASFVTPERRLLKFDRSSFTIKGIISYVSSSLWNYTTDLILLIPSNWILQLESFISTKACSSSALGFSRGFRFYFST